MPYDQTREGRGRWAAIQTPAHGVLWTNDADAVGFQPAPQVDPAPVTNLLDTYSDAGRTATEAFDQIVVAIGTKVTTGELAHWKPDNARPFRLRR